VSEAAEMMHHKGTKNTKAQGRHPSQPALIHNRLSLWERPAAGRVRVPITAKKQTQASSRLSLSERKRSLSPVRPITPTRRQERKRLDEQHV